MKATSLNILLFILGLGVGAFYFLLIGWLLKILPKQRIAPIALILLLLIKKIIIIAIAAYILIQTFSWTSLIPFLVGVIFSSLVFVCCQMKKIKERHDRTNT